MDPYLLVFFWLFLWFASGLLGSHIIISNVKIFSWDDDNDRAFGIFMGCLLGPINLLISPIVVSLVK